VTADRSYGRSSLIRRSVRNNFVVVFKAGRHDRCSLKRVRNGVRIQLTRLPEISELVEQNKVHGHKVRGSKGKVLVSSFDIRSVCLDVNPKLGHASIVGSFDQLFAPTLPCSLPAKQQVRNCGDSCAAYGASGSRNGDEDGHFHSGDPFDEAVSRRQFPLEMAEALAEIYFPPRRNTVERILHVCRGIFHSLFCRRMSAPTEAK